MKFSRPFLKLTWFALPLLVIMSILIWCFPAKAPNGFSTWIIALEFAWNHNLYMDVMNMVEAGAATERVSIGHTVDFAFMLAYSGLLAFFFFVSWKRRQQKWILLGLVLSSIAFFADVLETQQLISLNSLLPVFSPPEYTEPLLKTLQIYTWVKWEVLALSFALIAVLVWDQKWWKKGLAVCMCFPLILSIPAATYQPAFLEAFSLSVSLGFLFLLLYCFLKKDPPSGTELSTDGG